MTAQGFHHTIQTLRQKAPAQKRKINVFILFKKHNSDPNSDHDVTEDFMGICLLCCFFFFFNGKCHDSASQEKEQQNQKQ